jgi:two-component system phosphate regulon response regulator PhoB
MVAKEWRDAEAILRLEKPAVCIIDHRLFCADSEAQLSALRAASRARNLPIALLFDCGNDACRSGPSLDLPHVDALIYRAIDDASFKTALLSLIRRQRPASVSGRWSASDVVLDEEAFTLSRSGRSVVLAQSEFRLLAALVDHFPNAVSRATLRDLLWGEHSDISDRAVDLGVARLRRALSPLELSHCIATIHRTGYRFTLPLG